MNTTAETADASRCGRKLTSAKSIADRYVRTCKYISHHSFMPFVVYRVVLALAIFALVSMGFLDPDAGGGAG